MDSRGLSEMSRVQCILDVHCDACDIPLAERPREGSITCCCT